MQNINAGSKKIQLEHFYFLFFSIARGGTSSTVNGVVKADLFVLFLILGEKQK